MVSRAISNTALKRSLAQAPRAVLGAGTTQRMVYADSLARGGTVFEGRASAARREMEAIRDEIKEMLP